MTSAQQAFRNKAKMVVSGSVERPVLGMVQCDGTAVDLSGCPLYPASFTPVFTALKPFIARAGLTSYNVVRRRGELKFLLLTESTQGSMMLRSREKLDQLRAALPWLQQLLQLQVILANIQPVHMVILEKALTRYRALDLGRKAFSRPTRRWPSRLYAATRDWVRALNVGSIWDLFCGVGSFGLHCATPQMQLTGIEINTEAITCAPRSAEMLGLEKVSFAALDSNVFATGHDAVPDLVLINPPRHGAGYRPAGGV